MHVMPAMRVIIPTMLLDLQGALPVMLESIQPLLTLHAQNVQSVLIVVVWQLVASIALQALSTTKQEVQVVQSALQGDTTMRQELYSALIVMWGVIRYEVGALHIHNIACMLRCFCSYTLLYSLLRHKMVALIVLKESIKRMLPLCRVLHVLMVTTPRKLPPVAQWQTKVITSRARPQVQLRSPLHVQRMLIALVRNMPLLL
jgi:hypothetical protein